jgi:developmental checkpoint coupling sporulation initiation to replication initiation
MSLQLLSDQSLIKSFMDAVKLNLSPEFISLLKKEIEKRSLEDLVSQ